MKIGILGAMQEEIIFLKEKTKKIKIKIIGNFKFYIGYLHGINIILVESGIGKVSSSIATTIILILYKPDFIINIGTAGSLISQLKIGDIIIPNETCYHDVNVKIFDYKIGQIPNYPTYFIIDNTLASLSKEYIKKLNYRYESGLIVTGDSFIYEKKSLISIKNNFPSAIAIDMESTAIAQTCYKFHTPFLIIRAISDTADKNSVYDFKKNVISVNYHIKMIVEYILKKIDVNYIT